MMFLSNDGRLIDTRLIIAKECDNGTNFFTPIEFKGIIPYTVIQLGKILVPTALVQSIGDDRKRIPAG